MGRIRSYALRGFVLAVIALIIGGYLVFSALPGRLASKLSDTLKVAVTVADITMTPWKIAVHKLAIANPAGTRLPVAFSVNTITSQAPVTNYLKDHVVVDTLILDDVYLSLEFVSAKAATGNWTQLMSNVKNTQDKGPSNTGKSLLIKKVIIRNIRCDVVYHDRNSGVIQLPVIEQMEFTDISSEGGLPMDQFMSSVLGKMLKQIFIQQNLQDMLNKLLDPSQQLDNLFKGGQNVLKNVIKPFW